MRISDWSSDVCSSDLFGTRIGRKDQPAFILSARKARLPRRFVVGMNLDRQPLGCEKKFDQQRRIVAGRVFEPYLPDPPPGAIAKGHGQVDPAPGLFDAAQASGGRTDTGLIPMRARVTAGAARSAPRCGLRPRCAVRTPWERD